MQLILLNKCGLDSGGGGLILLSAETPLVFSQWYDITDAFYFMEIFYLLICGVIITSLSVINGIQTLSDQTVIWVIWNKQMLSD